MKSPCRLLFFATANGLLSGESRWGLLLVPGGWEQEAELLLFGAEEVGTGNTTGCYDN